MLHIYRRHKKSCPQTKQTYKRCDCPIYVKGALGGVHIRESMGQSDWNAAQQIVGGWIKDGAIRRVTGSPTIPEAAVAYLADLDTRGLQKSTRKKYSLLLRRLELHCAAHHGLYAQMTDITLDSLTRFRSTWPGAMLVKVKTQERLKTFLRFCKARRWLLDDPSEHLSALHAPHVPTLPFTADEYARTLAACDRYPTLNAYGYDNRARMRAMVLLLKWTGIRIGDAVTLEWQRVVNNQLFLRTQKTGTRVNLPLHREVVAALAALDHPGRYVFWTGRGDPTTVTAGWQRSFRALFKLAKVRNGHAHRFRDTFAVELLLKGMELSEVSMLLGHSSIKVTEKHYSPWVRSRQDRLESNLTKTWDVVPAGPESAPPSMSVEPSTSAWEAPSADLHLGRAGTPALRLIAGYATKTPA